MKFTHFFSDNVKSLDLNEQSGSALGIPWSYEEDAFYFDDLPNTVELTKRGLLSAIAGVFDPLGLIGFDLVSAKIVLQEAFRLGLAWDEPFPEEISVKVHEWIGNLERLQSLKIPRLICNASLGSIDYQELHMFSDASQSCFATTAFLRTVHSGGKISCSLVASKNRLAPIKGSTIPRLELQGAVLAARLYNVIKRELNINFASVTFWTDSTSCLGMIRNRTARFHVYVANRVCEIQESTNIDDWRYVPTDLNTAADGLSRGSFPDTFLNCPYFQGPEFLFRSSEHWPGEPGNLNLEPDPNEIVAPSST